MKHKSFLKSVAVISAGGLVAKAIGALYRIPLTGVLGGYGMGLYQMAYPFFCVLLTFSSAGIPSAFARVIAKETAEGRQNADTVGTALKLFALLGLCGTLLMCVFAPAMSALQGDGGLLPCYLALAPSVFLVALIAVYRGYFQGKNDMAPTAVSEIVEQVVKAGAGLFFAYRYADDPARAVAYTLAAVTVSEGAALIYLSSRYRAERKMRSFRVRRVAGVQILAAALPVMAASALLPLSQMADSVVIVRLLSRYTARAVALYGLFSGGAVALVNLPATVCYGLGAASVPAVSAACARGEWEEGRNRAFFALGITLLLSVPCAVGLFVLARPVVALLYGSLSAEDAETLVTLVRLSSVSAATLAGVQTLSACLTGMGRAKCAALSMLAAVTVKFLLQWLLVGNPAFSVGGAAIASNACYRVAFFLDLVYTVKKKREKNCNDYDCRLGDGEGGSDGAGYSGGTECGRRTLAHGADAFRRKPEGGGNCL